MIKNKKANILKFYLVLLILIISMLIFKGNSWASGIDFHNVTFTVGNYGTVTSGQVSYNVADNSSWNNTITVPIVEGKSGYEFTGWSPVFPSIITEDLNFIAQFKAEDKTAYVQFIVRNGGSVISGQTSYVVPKNSKWSDVITVPTIRTDEGYSFKGWDLVFPETITEDISFIARFEETVPEDEFFTVYFISEKGGSTVGETVFNVKSGSTWNESVTVPNIKTENGYKFAGWSPNFPTIINKEHVFVANILKEGTTTEGEKTEEEKKKIKPEVEYAYMLNGELIVKIKGEEQLGSNSYSGIVNGKEVEDIRAGIKIEEYPTKLTIEIENIYKNKATFTFNILMKDQVLSGEVPTRIKDRINNNQRSDIDFFEGFEHIVEGQQNKVINIYDSFKRLILKEYGAHNDGDIVITGKSGLKVEDNYDVILSEDGLFTFTIGHTFYKDHLIDVYVYVDTNKVKYTNIKDFHIVNPGLISESSVKLIDFLRFELIKEGYAPDTKFIIAKDLETEKDISLDTNINLEEDFIYKYRIRDLLTEETSIIEFMKQKEIEITTASFSDVPAKHWAFYSIKDLTLNKFLSGYPDKTFRPNTNITVREFSTILSRYMSKLDSAELKPVVEDYYIRKDAKWGYVETRAVLSTIPRKKMESFNISNVDRFITREEVAFLLSNNLNLELNRIKSTPLDAISSKYPVDVLTVISSKLMQGYPDGTFKPSLNITRAEIAAIFDRLLNPEE